MKKFVFTMSFLLGLSHGLRTEAHDIWTNAREYNKPTGFPCCGGDQQTGDCEGLTADQVWDQPDGSVIIYSSRYKARIFIPAHRVMPDLPRYVDGPDKGQSLDPLVQFEAHYCGKPRGLGALGGYPVTDDDPDPNFHLFCFFRNAGGM